MKDVPPSERTLPALLERQAAAFGERPYLQVGDTVRTYAEMRDAVARTAGSFAAAGVRRGDRVAIMAENRRELVDAWFGCAWLGAALVPLNTATRGPQLEHVLMNSGPRVLAIEQNLFPHLEVIEMLPPELERIWLLEGEGADFRGLPVEAFPPLGEALPPSDVAPDETVSILYTSGTTGPSKGVMCPQAQFYWWALSTASMLGGLTEDDVLYTCLPLFHTNALNACIQALHPRRPDRRRAALLRLRASGRASPRRTRPSPTCSAPWSRSSPSARRRPRTARTASALRSRRRRRPSCTRCSATASASRSATVSA